MKYYDIVNDEAIENPTGTWCKREDVVPQLMESHIENLKDRIELIHSHLEGLSNHDSLGLLGCIFAFIIKSYEKKIESKV